MTVTVQVSPRIGEIHLVDASWGDIPQPLQDALGARAAEPYLRMAYQTAAEFTMRFAVEPGTVAYEAAWAAQVARCKAALIGAYDDDDRICALVASRPGGTPTILAMMQTVRSGRTETLDQLPGNPQAGLPTHRTLWFRYGLAPQFVAEEISERSVVEFGRLVVAEPRELAVLVAEGTLTHGQARQVTARGFATVLARSFWREQRRPEPPAAILFNVKPLLARRMQRSFNLICHPLFAASGATPSRRVLEAGQFSSDYFGHYRTALAHVVPAEIMACGIAVAVRHLVEIGFTGWEHLPISLPYLFINDEDLRVAMDNLTAMTGDLCR